MTAKALVVGAFGARGVGKTAWLRQQLEREPCLAIWDYKPDPRMADWGKGFISMPGFIQALRAPRFCIRYMPNRHHSTFTVDQQFDLFCRAAYQRGRMAIFVDELPMVTRANKAPESWRECVNTGREYLLKGKPGVHWLSIYVTAQRPNEVDKSLISNLDVVHTGRLAFANDALTMSKSIGVKPEVIMALPDLHYLEKSAKTPRHVAGVLHFTKKSSGMKKGPKDPA